MKKKVDEKRKMQKDLPEEEAYTSSMVYGVFRKFAVLSALVIFIWIFCTFLGRFCLIDGTDMEKTLPEHSLVYVDQMVPKFYGFTRFDVVLYQYIDADNKKKEAFGRIAGMPGESVQLQDGQLIIDGSKVALPANKKTHFTAGYAKTAVTLGEEEYFILADADTAQADSRTLDEYGLPVVGPVEEDAFIGVARWIINPKKKLFGKVE